MVEKLNENKILREEILLNRERIEKKDVEGKIIKQKRKKIAELWSLQPWLWKTSLRKEERREEKGMRSNTAIPLKNRKTRGRSSSVFPWSRYFFPADELTDYFSSRNYARDAWTQFPRDYPLSISTLESVIALLPKPYNSRNLFIYLFSFHSLTYPLNEVKKRRGISSIRRPAVNRSPFDHPFFISLTNFKQSLAISRGRKRGGPSSIGRSPVRRWPKGSTLAIA